MSTVLFSHAACLQHETGFGHPEAADRLRAVLRGLEAEDFHYLERQEAPRATVEQIARVHHPAYVKRLLAAMPDAGLLTHLDADTVISAGSAEAALRAAGAACAAVDAVVAGSARNAFCAVRPPGHHAEPDRAMGFCLFNNVAVGAMQARAAHGIGRIAIVDFDVHHGNGTQLVAETDAGLFYGSTHQWPLYPGSGHGDERGLGNVLNLMLAPGAGSAEFRRAVERDLLPGLDAFRPELVMISAGFDAHASDPLANLNLTDADYGWVTQQLCALASIHAAGRVVSVLEGGYNLRALAGASAAHVRALMTA